MSADLPDFGPVTSSDDDDFSTDSENESESDHEEEEYEWSKPRTWATELRRQPDLATFAKAWTSPAKRDSIPSLHTDLPQQEPSFNIEPNGDLPFALMFLDALPLNSFWRDVVKRETRRYAEQNQATPGRADRRRSWDEPKMNTVANWLRVTAAIIMRGLVSASSDSKFFADETYIVGDKRYDRPGAQSVCGIDINTYEQLLRFFHLADSTARPCRDADDHDKAWACRPIIVFLNAAFKRWFNAGRDNALDEGGLPSRHSWLRIRNPDKPHRYFIEMLMACCSTCRFCWHFQLNEGTTKIVKRSNRERGQSRYTKVPYYNPNYNEAECNVQGDFGVGATHMLYFSRVLRSFDDSDMSQMCYRMFTDRRWCSLPGMYLAKKDYNVSYTCTVKSGSRYHVCNLLPVVQSKKRRLRGKYRSAFVQLDEDVRIVAVCWNDSAKCGYASCDLGTEGETTCVRRCGRWKRDVTHPFMCAQREKRFRAIDRHDQLRLGKCHFEFQCRNKAWPKVHHGGIEILLVNIFIICERSVRFHKIKQREFRWTCVLELVTMADRLDQRARDEDPTDPRGRSNTDRFQGRDSHHHATWPEYVDKDQLQSMTRRMEQNPGRSGGPKKNRERDGNCVNGKIRNPAWYESNCIVCWAVGKKRRTARYCIECSLDPNWTFKCRIGGWAKECQPRLCSTACWNKFHTLRIHGLDFNQRRSQRQRRGRPVQSRVNSRSRRRSEGVTNHSSRRRRTRRRLQTTPTTTPEQAPAAAAAASTVHTPSSSSTPAPGPDTAPSSNSAPVPTPTITPTSNSTPVRRSPRVRRGVNTAPSTVVYEVTVNRVPDAPPVQLRRSNRSNRNQITRMNL